MSEALACLTIVMLAWVVQALLMGNVDRSDRRELIFSFVSVKGLVLVPSVMALALGFSQDANAYVVGALDFVDCSGESDVVCETVLDFDNWPKQPPEPDGHAVPASTMLALVTRRFALAPPVQEEKTGRGGRTQPSTVWNGGGSRGRISGTNRPASRMEQFRKKR